MRFLLLLVLFIQLMLVNNVDAKVIRVTPRDVIRMTLLNNERVQLAVLDFKIAIAEVWASSVDFDTHLTLIPSYQSNHSLTNSTNTDFSSTEATSAIAFGLTQKLRLGTEIELTVQDLYLTNNASTSSFSAWYQTAGLVKVTQPLLKGGGILFNTYQERLSKAKALRFTWKLKETTDTQIEKTLGLFWDLYEAEQQVKIDIESLRLARENLASDSALTRAGRKSSIDQLQSLAQVELAVAKVALKQADYFKAEEKLAREILPLKEPLGEFYIQTIVNLKALSTAAISGNARKNLEKNATINRSKVEIYEAGIELDKSKNAIQPKLDLSLEYLSSGLKVHHPKAIGDLTKQNFPSWQIALEFSYPLGNEGAEGDFKNKFEKHEGKVVTFEKEKDFAFQKLLKSNRKLVLIGKTLQSIQGRLDKEKEKVEGKKKLYRFGRIAWREYIDSLNAYNDLLSEEVNSLTTYEREKVTLATLMGSVGGSLKAQFLELFSI